MSLEVGAEGVNSRVISVEMIFKAIRLDEITQEWIKIEERSRDFPCGSVVKNLPCNAGDVDSIPGGGAKILYAVEQLKSMCHD